MAAGVGEHTKQNEKEARPLIFNPHTVYTGRYHAMSECPGLRISRVMVGDLVDWQGGVTWFPTEHRTLPGDILIGTAGDMKDDAVCI